MQQLSPSEAALALDANEIASFTMFQHLPNVTFHNEQGLVWFETSIRHDVFNRVLQARLAPNTASTAIDKVVSHFQRQRMPFLWHIGASSFPASLGSLLEERGLIHHETEPEMMLDLSKFNENISIASGITIHPVNTETLLQQWLHIWELGSLEEVIHLWFTFYREAYLHRETPLRLYLGTLDDEPVATSGVFLGESVATIGPIGTLPHLRRQGIGATMTLAALREARAQGYRIATLNASPMGIEIYRRIGFRECGSSSLYLWHPTKVS
jgi:GNAT superfamily N-acetyltransferase